MALSADDKKEVRRLARLEAAAVQGDIAGDGLPTATNINTTTGRYLPGDGHALNYGKRRNNAFDVLDAAHGGNPFA